MHLLYATDRHVDAYLVKALREAGHVVDVTDQPADGVVMASGGDYQAILLDWSAPSLDCARRYAGACGEALLLIVAAQGDETERAAVLKAGADACFIRPIQFIEIEARLAALARLVGRARPATAVRLVPAERAVHLNGQAVLLSPREFHLMEHLVAHAGEVVGVERLQQQAWGEAAEPRPDLVRASIARLRRKLDAVGAGRVVRAMAGYGYMFLPDEA